MTILRREGAVVRSKFKLQQSGGLTHPVLKTPKKNEYKIKKRFSSKHSEFKNSYHSSIT